MAFLTTLSTARLKWLDQYRDLHYICIHLLGVGTPLIENFAFAHYYFTKLPLALAFITCHNHLDDHTIKFE